MCVCVCVCVCVGMCVGVFAVRKSFHKSRFTDGIYQSPCVCVCVCVCARAHGFVCVFVCVLAYTIPPDDCGICWLLSLRYGIPQTRLHPGSPDSVKVTDFIGQMGRKRQCVCVCVCVCVMYVGMITHPFICLLVLCLSVNVPVCWWYTNLYVERWKFFHARSPSVNFVCANNILGNYIWKFNSV